MTDGIKLEFPAQPLELIRLATSRVLEAAQSWHVLADPSHHALHLPWVRACRRLPAALRRELRAQSFAIRGYIPAFLEAGIGHPDATITDELELIRAVPPGQIVPELVRTLVDWQRDDDLADSQVQADLLAAANPDERGWLRGIFADPERVRDRLLTVIGEYWSECFAEEYDRLEPRLHAAMENAARTLVAAGPLGLLHELVPEVVLDPAHNAVLIPRTHRHQLNIGEHGGITLVPSVYAWPHVRVNCDHPPWPLVLIFPIDSLVRPLAATISPDMLHRQLRAIAGPRLELLRLTTAEPRSTQELARLTQSSEAAISKHLQALLAAGLLTRHRDGYYVLYQADAGVINAFLRTLGDELSPRPHQR